MSEEGNDSLLWKDPTGCFNESGFPLCPKSSKVLSPRVQADDLYDISIRQHSSRKQFKQTTYTTVQADHIYDRSSRRHIQQFKQTTYRSMATQADGTLFRYCAFSLKNKARL